LSTVRDSSIPGIGKLGVTAVSFTDFLLGEAVDVTLGVTDPAGAISDTLTLVS
jgi:hypothetical protein